MVHLGPIEEQLALLSASACIGGAVALAAIILGSTGAVRVPRIGWRVRASACGGAIGVGIAAISARVMSLGASGVADEIGLAVGAVGLSFLPAVVESALRSSAGRRSAQALAVVSRRLDRGDADEASVARVSAAISDAARAA